VQIVLCGACGLGWAHEFADTQRTATAFFAGVPGTSFTVDGAYVPRDAALLRHRPPVGRDWGKADIERGAPGGAGLMSRRPGS
jgi:hypothetical protein